MKKTAALALCVLTLSVAGCTTTDETPPGEESALAEEESSDEDEGIPAEGEGEGDQAEATGGSEGGGGSQGEKESQDSSSQTSGSGGQSGSGDLPDASSMDDEVCVAFFEGMAPVAAQVLDGRELVAQGAEDHLTEVEFMEVDVLAEQLDELGTEGSSEQAALLASINMPFSEVKRAAEEGGTDAESGEVTYEPVEMTDSEEAQKEFTSSCTSSGGSG